MLCKIIEPVTAAVADTPLAITLEAMTSGAGIGNSPNRGIVKVATVSSVDKVSLGSSRSFGIVSGVSFNTSSVEDVVSSSTKNS